MLRPPGGEPRRIEDFPADGYDRLSGYLQELAGDCETLRQSVDAALLDLRRGDFSGQTADQFRTMAAEAATTAFHAREAAEAAADTATTFRMAGVNAQEFSHNEHAAWVAAVAAWHAASGEERAEAMGRPPMFPRQWA